MARKLSGRSISIHRSYPVRDIAEILGVHKGTVQRWIRSGRLKPNDDYRPMLVHGKTLREFLKQRQPKKHRCGIDEWYCMKCRMPRKAAFSEAEITTANGKTCNVLALCETCGTAMHKRVSFNHFPAFQEKTRLTNSHRFAHLIE